MSKRLIKFVVTIGTMLIVFAIFNGLTNGLTNWPVGEILVLVAFGFSYAVVAWVKGINMEAITRVSNLRKADGLWKN